MEESLAPNGGAPAAQTVELAASLFALGFVVLSSATFGLAYVVSIATGAQQYPLLFLSSSIDYSPGANVGSFGLGLTVAAAALTVLVRRQQLRGCAALGRSAQKANELAALVGWAACLGAYGVANIQVLLPALTPRAARAVLPLTPLLSSQFHVSLAGHATSAMLFFPAGTVYMAMQSWIDRQLSGDATAAGARNKMRSAAGVCGVLVYAATGVYASFFLRSLPRPCFKQYPKNYPCYSEPVYFTLAVMEVLLYASFTVHLLSYFLEWRVAGLTLRLELNAGAAGAAGGAVVGADAV